MAIPLHDRLGALRERDFRLLFTGTMITTIGDRLAGIALAFAVLDIGSATALGIVFAVRQGVQALVVVGGGVLSDRLPGTSCSSAPAWSRGRLRRRPPRACSDVRRRRRDRRAPGRVRHRARAGAPGGGGTRSPDRQPRPPPQANALQGLTRNIVGVLGPAVGGAIVVAGSPGIALAVDAASFFVCADLLRRIRVAAHDTAGAPGFVAELREGWQEFTCRTWLWASVVLFGIGNLAFAGWNVLGPAVADQRLGGAGAWAVILTAGGAGAVLGSIVAIRVRPRRPLVVCVLFAALLSLHTLALALGAPTWAIAAASFVSGFGISVHLTLWFTVFQQQVPERAQSRVASYDTLGSFVLMPLGMALVGPCVGFDRDHRDAVDRRGRHVGVVGGDSGAAVRVGDPGRPRGAGSLHGLTTIPPR